MKIEVRKELLKVTNPLIRFDGPKRVRMITVTKVVKTNRIFVR
mgnify:CR=1 FL=1